MPIVLVSVDSKNASLSEFKNLTKTVDVLLEATTSEATKLADYMSSFISFTSRVDTDRLNPPADGESELDVSIRMQAVFNLVKSLNVVSAMIISHHSVFNAWKKSSIGDEWEIISMI